MDALEMEADALVWNSQTNKNNNTGLSTSVPSIIKTTIQTNIRHLESTFIFPSPRCFINISETRLLI